MQNDSMPACGCRILWAERIFSANDLASICFFCPGGFMLQKFSIEYSIDVDAHLGVHRKAKPYFVEICILYDSSTLLNR